MREVWHGGDTVPSKGTSLLDTAGGGWLNLSILFNLTLFKTKWSLSAVRLQPTTASLQPFLDFAGPNLDSCRLAEVGLSGRLPTSPHCLFRTCFSLGRGRWRDPSSTTPSAWFNLKKMEFQPSLCVVVNEGENNEQGVLGRNLGSVEDRTEQPQDDNDDKAVNPPPPYTCHTSNDCSYQLNQSLKISNSSNEKTTTVPIFILELALPTNQETLFLLTLKVSI